MNFDLEAYEEMCSDAHKLIAQASLLAVKWGLDVRLFVLAESEKEVELPGRSLMSILEDIEEDFRQRLRNVL